MNTQIVTGKVRFSYVNVFTPRAQMGGDEKYSVTLLIPKTDKATLAKIDGAIKAAKAKYSESHNGKAAPTKTTLHDGDGPRPSDGEPFSEECKGCMVISVSSTRKPPVIDANKVPITEPTEFYSGCYGRAIINFYAYDTNGNRGISAGLNGLMKLYDGEPLGGGIITDSDWDDGWEDTDDFDGLLD